MKKSVGGIKYTLATSPPTILVYFTQWAADVLSCMHDWKAQTWLSTFTFYEVFHSKNMCAKFSCSTIHELKLFLDGCVLSLSCLLSVSFSFNFICN